MSERDFSGLPITAADRAAAAGYDRYVREFLSYGRNLRALFDVADAAPGSALIQAHAAALHLAFEGAEGWANAHRFLVSMRQAARYGASARERLFIDAVEQWAARDYFGAMARLDELTTRWPADLCALKWGQYHAFNLGDQAALLRFARRAGIVHRDRPYVHGMIAFALEQNHELEEAEYEGLKATEIALDDGWAHHAVAHVMDTQRRAREGIRWLDRCSHTWDNKGVFIRDHNWWHAALFRISLGLNDEALAIFDARLWGAWPEFPQEQIGAVSALWRLEMHGVDVGHRWAPLVEQVKRRAGEHLFAFHDLHFAYALARGGVLGLVPMADAERFVAATRAHAESLEGPAGLVWRETLLPAMEGAVSFARGDLVGAQLGLGRAAPTLTRLGGSHAQRQLFLDTLAMADGRAQRTA